MVVGVGVFAPFVIGGWFVTGRPAMSNETLVLGFLSGILEAAYFICLSAAYQRGDLSVVYPIARGTAPILSVALGIVVLGERLKFLGVVGVAALLIGILLVQQPWRAIAMLRGRSARRAAGTPSNGPGAAEYALLTGVMIAAYSAVDRAAVQGTPPWLYAGVVFPVGAVALVLWVRFVADRRGRETPRTTAPASWVRSGAAGTMSLGAYGLILLAYTLAPLTAVAPLRESSVVIASAWGAIQMREAIGTADRVRRIGGACLVLVGAVLLGVEG
jgi:uncharacterized membrane protein